jgi:hypothetical protein
MLIQQDFMNAMRWAGFEGTFADWRTLSTDGKRPFH